MFPVPEVNFLKLFTNYHWLLTEIKALHDMNMQTLCVLWEIDENSFTLCGATNTSSKTKSWIVTIKFITGVCFTGAHTCNKPKD